MNTELVAALSAALTASWLAGFDTDAERDAYALRYPVPVVRATVGGGATFGAGVTPGSPFGDMEWPAVLVYPGRGGYLVRKWYPGLAVGERQPPYCNRGRPRFYASLGEAVAKAVEV